ncbi:MAG: D-xylose transport system substrate-binding protein [Streptosporangiaceae bacterium]|jgi:D-xylose transport system substrate-binding protein|nr:D-xylose transport system substrate-binding protein [Streptosporangiaceae bacterium]
MTAARLASVLMATLAAAGLAGGGLTACARPPEPRSAAAQGQMMPSVSAGSFSTGFSVMRRLKALGRIGTGKIGVLLPDTTTSPRYTEFDAPYLARALQEAGLSRSQVIISNAQGSDATQQAQAESDMTQGATVLLLDPIDSGVGASIESAAASLGVKVIDYDRMTLGGTRAFYVSFDNVAVGALMARGLVNCIRAWHVRHPDVLVMRGAPTDNNATLFARGYDQVLRPYFASRSYTDAGRPPGTWNPTTAQTTFEEQYTNNNKITAVLTPNDDTAGTVISYLKTLNTPPRAVPTTGQDATPAGLANILSGYQCGTVYKPIYLEAQAAAALTLYLRAGLVPPASLVNGTTFDPTGRVRVPSVLLRPIWVTAASMAATVIRDRFVTAAQLCGGSLRTACRRARIAG